MTKDAAYYRDYRRRKKEDRLQASRATNDAFLAWSRLPTLVAGLHDRRATAHRLAAWLIGHRANLPKTLDALATKAALKVSKDGMKAIIADPVVTHILEHYFVREDGRWVRRYQYR